MPQPDTGGRLAGQAATQGPHPNRWKVPGSQDSLDLQLLLNRLPLGGAIPSGRQAHTSAAWERMRRPPMGRAILALDLPFIVRQIFNS